MIVFDLKCSGGHVFEAWFRSSADYALQRGGGLIPCAICGDTDITKAVMAPNISTGASAIADRAMKNDDKIVALESRAEPVATPSGGADGKMPAIAPEALKAAIAHIAAVQAKALASSQWVGAAFAQKARAMHAGEQEVAAIHGQATPDEARALAEEGVPVMPLIVPVIPPDQRN